MYSQGEFDAGSVALQGGVIRHSEIFEPKNSHKDTKEKNLQMKRIFLTDLVIFCIFLI
jgi:hypothetical protein